MSYEPTKGVYRYIDEQIAFPQHTKGDRHVQPIPKRDVKAAVEAQRQAEARARQRNLRSNTRIPPNAYPKVRQRTGRREDDEIEEDELYTRPPRSAIRYEPEEIYQQGNKRVHVQYADIPPRRSAQQPHPTYDTYDEDEQETQRPLRTRPKVQLHRLVFVGVSLLLMIAGWIAFTDLGTWWQEHQDDSTYGNPRTYQTDAVVGHGDSNSDPSHFIALNLKGEIVVIELPGGNVKNARSYPITTLPGNQGNPPVRLVFQDFDHDGKLDMLVQIGDSPNAITFMLFNNGTAFVGKS